MRYTIRRISVSSIMRFGCALGWLLAVLPALTCAGFSVAALQRIYQTLQLVEPITLSLFGQNVARIDLLETLRLRSVEQSLGQWMATPLITVLLLTLILVLLGSLLCVVIGGLVGWAYNLLAAAGWGLTLELQAEGEQREKR